MTGQKDVSSGSTEHKCVTYVPGLICYLCARFYIQAAFGRTKARPYNGRFDDEVTIRAWEGPQQ